MRLVSSGPPKGGDEPGRAHEIGELGLDLGAMLGLDRLVDRPRARRQGPGERHRAIFGEARDRADVAVDQRVDVRRIEPEVGQRIERLAGGDGVAEEDGVDPARARAGEDVDDDAQIGVRLRGDVGQQAGE